VYSIPRSSYYDKHYRQSEALIRARRPFLVRNILTGVGIFSFAIGVCKYVVVLMEYSANGDTDAFTIKAVAQDDFEDVKVPDAPLQPPKTPNVGASSTSSAPLSNR
jgi:cytochrome c oxidase assembly factor 3